MLLVDSTSSGIEFQNVTFGYNETNKILDQLNFKIEPGRKIALVGGSGSGYAAIRHTSFRVWLLLFQL
jgi:ABC-type multidrug transport system fused ATPase/permease subunit